MIVPTTNGESIALPLGCQDIGAASSTPNYLLRKELDFKYLAALDVVTSLAMTVTAPGIALVGLGYWALVGEQVVAVIVRTIAFWPLRRPWKFVLSFDAGIARSRPP